METPTSCDTASAEGAIGSSDLLAGLPDRVHYLTNRLDHDRGLVELDHVSTLLSDHEPGMGRERSEFGL